MNTRFSGLKQEDVSWVLQVPFPGAGVKTRFSGLTNWVPTAPTARNEKAQASGLGPSPPWFQSPEGARDCPRLGDLAPLQGLDIFGVFFPQAFDLGYHITARWAY